jgi:kinesin family protein 18/19
MCLLIPSIIVFAYGATGAGKTHTMLGTQQNPGIIFLTVMDLYRRMEELRGTKKFEISVSYLEVKTAFN